MPQLQVPLLLRGHSSALEPELTLLGCLRASRSFTADFFCRSRYLIFSTMRLLYTLACIITERIYSHAGETCRQALASRSARSLESLRENTVGRAECMLYFWPVCHSHRDFDNPTHASDLNISNGRDKLAPPSTAVRLNSSMNSRDTSRSQSNPRDYETSLGACAASLFAFAAVWMTHSEAPPRL